MTSEPHRIALPNGDVVEATLWEVPGAKAVILVHPATAVTQRYYEPFAHYLSQLGFSVVTYDYRGTGRARPALRGFAVSMSDWIDQDVGGVTRWAAGRFPDVPLLAVGHSLGGHALALGVGIGALRAGVMIASHAGVTATIRGAAERARVWLVMRVLTPLLCPLFGYMPGRRFGLGEDLPRGVMQQWSRWTAMPNYFFDDPNMDAARRMATVRLPLLVLGFEDDPWANRVAIDKLTAPLLNAQMERRHITPAEAGLAAIGHMGFFRKRAEATLWPLVGNWLLAQSR
ncbi:alpha/beta hydrolase [Massilia eurypsychrophila]|jgi:predicted alpha/beta hydrolase|uniref:Alpha/beta hydrolase n=1 Tax=Massilia eurypsychrophila TaxID=1485217 RepID=A0A2G8TFV5_9BURK|nr:alpha/beta fold hydrolase [Massilia eurypsychrophila]PIL44922.1 alpha/beta hydrolase [Massilia eurypsychrophila]